MSLAPIGHPGFVFRGKTYKTITGLYNALAKHSGANDFSAVTKQNTIEARLRTKAGRAIVKTYCITPPAEGCKQFVAECFLKSELDRARRNAIVASAYNVVVASRFPATDHALPGGIRMSTAGLSDMARKLVMDCKIADMLPENHRIALLSAYAAELLREQQSGQQMIYTFADCEACLQFVNV